MKGEFTIKDMGNLHDFLGVEVTRSEDGYFLSQAKYAEELLESAGMSNCKPSLTPVDVKPKLSRQCGAPIADPSSYRSLAAALQYLTSTRPDIAYDAQQVCLHMHDTREGHLALIKRVLRHGLTLCRSGSLDITAYSDADWGGCLDTR